jgi:hypothetical protein
MRRLNMHLGRPNLLSFGFEGRGVFAFPISSHYISIKFPMCCCWCTLIGPHFIPYVLPKVELLYKVINYKGGVKGKHLYAFILGIVQCFQKNVMDESKVALEKMKKIILWVNHITN